MKTAEYIAQPAAQTYDAWAVWTAAKGEFVCCGNPRALQQLGMVVLCTAQQRLAQIQRVEQREREIKRALAAAEW